MQPSALVMSMMPIASPLKMLASSALKDLDKEPTFVALAGTIGQLAAAEEMDPVEFVQSGRAIRVLSALASGNPIPPKGATLAMDKCPNCNHVRYLID